VVILRDLMLVQYVVRNLKCQSQGASVAGNSVEVLACGFADDSSDTGCCRNQCACLEAIEVFQNSGCYLAFGQFQLFTLSADHSSYAGCLGYLSSELCDHPPSQNACNGGVRHNKKSLREQGVAGEKGDGFAKALMTRRLSSTKVVIVERR